MAAGITGAGQRQAEPTVNGELRHCSQGFQDLVCRDQKRIT